LYLRRHCSHLFLFFYASALHPPLHSFPTRRSSDLEVLQRYYQDNLFIPPEVLIPFDIEERELLADWLTESAGRRVGLRVPQRGRGVDRVELANRNARLSHESRFRKSQQDRLQVAAQKL